MILILSKYFNLKNGAARSALDMARATIESDRKTGLIYGQTFDYLNLDSFRKNENSIVLRSPRFGGKRANILEKMESVLLDNDRVNKLKRLKPDLLLVNSLGADFWGNHLRAYLDCPVVLVVRESPSFFKNLPAAVNRIKQFRQHMFVSKNGMHDWIKTAKLNSDSCIHIPNCMDDQKAQAVLKFDKNILRKRLGFADTDFILICIGRFMVRKNQLFLLEQLEELSKLLPNIKLVFIGKTGGKYWQRVFRFIREKKLQKYVICTGRKNNALEYIFASDILTVPSRAEASPRVIYEAMSLGIPSIAANVDGVPELIEHEKSGLLFNLENPELFIKGIVKLAEDEQLRHNLGKSARETYLENYTFEKYKHRMNEFFKGF